MNVVKVKQNQRLARLGWVIEHQNAVMHVAALDHLAGARREIDGHPPTGEQLHISGGGSVSTVESAALRAADIDTQAERIRSAAIALEHAQHAHYTLCRETLPNVPAASNANLCDGRRYEGQHLAWVPHSRDENNGWNDPLCRDLAGPTGLSDACLVRMNRWRIRHGLDPVNVQAAA